MRTKQKTIKQVEKTIREYLKDKNYDEEDKFDIDNFIDTVNDLEGENVLNFFTKEVHASGEVYHELNTYAYDLGWTITFQNDFYFSGSPDELVDRIIKAEKEARIIQNKTIVIS